MLKKYKNHIIKYIAELAGIALIAGLDQWFKSLAVSGLKGNPDGITLIPGFLGLLYCENTGGAFSIGTGFTNVLSIFTVVAVAGMLVYLAVPKKRSLVFEICVCAVVGGGIGNLIDRFANGFVVDYIRTLFIDFPIFNFADCFITCGCIALVIYLIYDTAREAKMKKTAQDAGADDGAEKE